jgi:hypothetical protein
MKIHIQYQTNQAHPAIIEVETDDNMLTPEEQLNHASDALDMALKVVWAEKARPTEPESRVRAFSGFSDSLAAGSDREAINRWVTQALTGKDAEGRPLFKVDTKTDSLPDGVSRTSTAKNRDAALKLINSLIWLNDVKNDEVSFDDMPYPSTGASGSSKTFDGRELRFDDPGE